MSVVCKLRMSSRKFHRSPDKRLATPLWESLNTSRSASRGHPGLDVWRCWSSSWSWVSLRRHRSRTSRSTLAARIMWCKDITCFSGPGEGPGGDRCIGRTGNRAVALRFTPGRNRRIRQPAEVLLSNLALLVDDPESNQDLNLSDHPRWRVSSATHLQVTPWHSTKCNLHHLRGPRSVADS